MLVELPRREPSRLAWAKFTRGFREWLQPAVGPEVAYSHLSDLDEVDAMFLEHSQSRDSLLLGMRRNPGTIC